jgi:hypothetical protein
VWEGQLALSRPAEPGAPLHLGSKCDSCLKA